MTSSRREFLRGSTFVLGAVASGLAGVGDVRGGGEDPNIRGGGSAEAGVALNKQAARARGVKREQGATYVETFDDGPGGWYGFISNAGGPKPLEIREGCAISRSPWWIDYNHAPPGAGYLHLLYILNTAGVPGEHQREVEGTNRFTKGGFPTDVTGARVTLRMKGELEDKGAELVLLCQSVQDGICSGWMLTGQPFRVTAELSEQTVTAVPDPAQWTCLGSRHDRTDYYGRIPLHTVLREVNTNIMLVLYPLNIQPMGPIPGDPHILRPERDYPVWRARLPEGYVMLDEVRIEFDPAQP